MLEFDWLIFKSSFPKLLEASLVTLKLLLASSFFGFIGAIFLGIMALSKNIVVRKLTEWHIFFYRGTPLLVQLYLIYYGSGQFSQFLTQVGLWDLFKSAWFCAWFAFTLNTSAYLGEIIKGAIINLPAGEIEAAQSFGMGTFKLYSRIILPRTIREILPAWGNEIILLLKASSLASVITIIDMMGMARKIASDTFAPIEVYIAAGILYLILTGVFVGIFKSIENRLLIFRRV